MTTNIDTLPAGRELDALVAERVMGWSNISRGADGDDAYGWNASLSGHVPPHGRIQIPKYSTNIAAAWEVVEKRLSTDGHFAFWPSVAGFSVAYHGIRTWDSEPVWEVWAETAPLAICRAALRAVGA